jgi:hypothetical protein
MLRLAVALLTLMSALGAGLAATGPRTDNHWIPRCNFVTGGVLKYDGPCEFDLKSGGSFVLLIPSVWTEGYLISMRVDGGEGRATVSTRFRDGLSEPVILAGLKRRGACWLAADTKVCAYEAGPAVVLFPEGDHALETTTWARRCIIEVEGTAYLDDSCLYSRFKDGSVFSIGGATRENGSALTAYIEVEGDTGEGSWNSAIGESHAHTSLGSLTKVGSCWMNDHAKVCVYE